MRLRSDQTEADGVRLNLQPNQNERSAGGGRFKFLKILGGRSGQASVSNLTVTDGPHLPSEEEPKKVILSFKQALEARRFCQASQLLIQTEERLFGEIKEADALKHHEEEVEKLAADYRELKKHVQDTLKLSFTSELDNVEALVSAVKAITQEEDRDQQWKPSDQAAPAWRPVDWMELHNTTLRKLVEERMDSPLTPPADHVEQSSIQVDVNSMGRQLKEDLLFVVDVVKTCYPPELDICNFYAKLYHKNFSARLRKLADFTLDNKDSTFLLRWVNEYYPQMLQKPQLASEINTEMLGKLLPKELLDPMEKQYLSKEQDELTTYVCRILDEAKEKWKKGEEPTREDGCFVSEVAYDIIQCINGKVTSAEKVVGDLLKAKTITCQLKDLLQRFRAFQNDVIKQKKPNSGSFIKANLGCIEQFIDVLQRKSDLFPKDVQINCLDVLRDMEISAHSYLLNPVHNKLRPQYRELGTSDWLNKPLFEKLLDSIEQEVMDLQGSIESAHQKLVGQLHDDVAVEYVKRLLKAKVQLKDKEQQLKACKTVEDNAESLHKLFVHMGSKDDWLKEILVMIAEVLKLQDIPAIQMQVTSLGAAYPDFSEKHLSALLKLKTNISKADRKNIKETLTESLGTSPVGTRPFFSKVQVK